MTQDGGDCTQVLSTLNCLFFNQMTYEFKVGDHVTKLYGKKVAVITNILERGYWGNNNIHCRYLKPNGKPGTPFYVSTSDIKPYEPDSEELPMETKTLYSFTKPDGTVAYGNHIGTNSSNDFLIEEKGTGTIHVLKKSEIEEVLPYTFSASMNGKETHYVCTPDSVKKGDVLLYTGTTGSMNVQLAVVTGVDTKNKTARSKFRGAKLVTESL